MRGGVGRGEEIPLRLASSLLLNIFETTMIVVVAFGRHPNVAVLGVFGSIPFFLLWVLGSHLLLVLFICLSLSLILLLGLFLSAFSSSSVVVANSEVLQAPHPIVQLYLTRIIDFQLFQVTPSFWWTFLQNARSALRARGFLL